MSSHRASAPDRPLDPQALELGPGLSAQTDPGRAQNKAPPRDKKPGRPTAPTEGLPNLSPVAEVAAVLGVSTRTVRRLIKAGELVAYRINRQVRVDVESVTRLLEASRIGASFRDPAWRNASISSASRISSDDEARRSSGPAGSRAARSRSGPPTASRPSDGSTNSSPRHDATLPQSAGELREALRTLQRRS